jgi:tetratricopeptide (TPR) repeat protein
MVPVFCGGPDPFPLADAFAMPTVAEAFALAVQHHQAGNFYQAERIYREILAVDSNHADACNNLASALLQQSKLDEAIHFYREALRLNPHSAAAAFNLGTALERQDKLDEAIRCYQDALLLNPDFAEAWNNLGIAEKNRGRPDEAIHCYRQAVRSKPEFVEAQINLANALRQQAQLEEAAAWYRQALRIKPDFAEVHNALANLLQEQGKPAEAVDSFRQALHWNPSLVEAHSDLANALLNQGKLEEAMAHCLQALRLDPDFPEAHNNLGAVLHSLGRLDEALAHYDRAVVLRPDYADAHWNRSLVWLLRGDFERGWPEYEWRWKRPRVVQRHFTQPLWDGTPLSGRTILLHAEQGLGDTLQFIRFAALLHQGGGKVIVECQPPLLPLLAGLPGIERLVAQSSQLPAFDVQAPLLSIPGLLHISPDTIPAAVPYLHADAALIAHWHRELAQLRGLKIGIAWQGSASFARNFQRSIPLAHFARLGQQKGVHLISLQKGPAADQLRTLGGENTILDLGSRLDEAAGAFVDTAAVMMNLDLVITADTAGAHLAGALGVAVWVALPLVPDWRWLLERDDSHWYPTMRLWRQTRYGHWDDVFDRLAEELRLWRQMPMR